REKRFASSFLTVTLGIVTRTSRSSPRPVPPRTTVTDFPAWPPGGWTVSRTGFGDWVRACVVTARSRQPTARGKRKPPPMKSRAIGVSHGNKVRVHRFGSRRLGRFGRVSDGGTSSGSWGDDP